MLFYKNDFGIKLPTKVDMLLNKETKKLTAQLVRLVKYTDCISREG